MHRIALLKYMLLPLTACFSLFAMAAMGSISYSYVDLIGRLTNLEHLAELPGAR